MYIIKEKNELEKIELTNINNFILNYFNESRLDTYDILLYKKINNEIIGFIGLNSNKYKDIYTNKNISILNQLCVKEEYRNKGISTNILKLLKNIYKNTIFLLYIDKNKYNTEYLYNYYKMRGFIEVSDDLINIPYYKNEEYAMISNYS